MQGRWQGAKATLRGASKGREYSKSIKGPPEAPKGSLQGLQWWKEGLGMKTIDLYEIKKFMHKFIIVWTTDAFLYECNNAKKHTSP